MGLVTIVKNKNYKRLYTIGKNNIFVIISDKIDNNKDQLSNRLITQLKSVPNCMETKLNMQIIGVKVINDYVFALARFQITNCLRDQALKIINQLKSLGFQQRQSDKIKNRNRLTITTQTPFF